jgi:streptogramin lyase
MTRAVLLAVVLAIGAGVASAAPLTFVWPTTVAVEPSGSLLLVENGLGRLLRVDPTTGRVKQLAVLTKPYAVVRARTGSIFVTDGPTLKRIDGRKAPVTVATASADIGPIAVSRGGSVFYSTDKAVFELVGGRGKPVRVAPKARLSAPHGLAVEADGHVLVSDTDHGRILRLDPRSGTVTTLARLAIPHGLAVAADGTIDVTSGALNRVIRLSRSGKQLGFVGGAFDDPYTLAIAPGGVVYVVESLQSGDVRRVAPDGTVTTVGTR